MRVRCVFGTAVKDVIKVSTKTLLEEPRAELTALHTMRLLMPAGLVSEVCTSLCPSSAVLLFARQLRRAWGPVYMDERCMHAG
jgi:hypothetical protein